jgi:hypothetical protein
MALTSGGRAPYAPAKTVRSVIDRHRSVGLPRVDLDTLERIGITEALRPRTLAALKILDFYDEEGRATAEFDHLKRVPAAEFPEHLGMLLRKAYAPVIEIIGEPADADTQAIEDAFRTFEPRGQLVRMVQLFVGLMTYAELMPESARRKPGPSKRSIRAPRGTVERIRAKGNSNTDEPAHVPHEPPPPPPLRDRSASQTVTLRSGGTMTLTVDVNPISLKGADRDFFYKVIDLLDGYDGQHAVHEQATASEPGGQPSGPN